LAENRTTAITYRVRNDLTIVGVCGNTYHWCPCRDIPFASLVCTCWTFVSLAFTRCHRLGV